MRSACRSMITAPASSPLANRAQTPARLRPAVSPWLGALLIGASGGCSSATHAPPAPLDGVAEIAVGAQHACARLNDGTVRCWGSNWAGQLGDGTTTDRVTAVAVIGLANVAEIALGAAFSCARLEDATVACWGSNRAGQLGDGTTTDRAKPVPVAGVVGVAQLALGATHACARRTDGTAGCWGSDAFAQLGVHAGSANPTPTSVPALGLSQVARLFAGANDVCALLAGGVVSCWGWNGEGQLESSSLSLHVPTEQPSLHGIEEIALGPAASCWRSHAVPVECRGSNDWGQLGNGGSRANTNLYGAAEIALGEAHACARIEDGTVACWGADGNGQLGDGLLVTRRVPASVAGLTSVVQIALGAAHSCARLSDGTVRCWGSNQNGQLGDGTRSDRAAPVTVTR